MLIDLTKIEVSFLLLLLAQPFNFKGTADEVRNSIEILLELRKKFESQIEPKEEKA